MRSKARFAGGAALLLVAAAVLAGVVMVLWNALVPGMFAGTHPIDYLHALGLLVLCRILFGGFHGHRGGHGHRHWARWHALTPEEREQFRRGGPWGESPQAPE